MSRFAGAAAILIGAAQIAVATPAQAIECRGDAQVIQGRLMPTPYCEDNYLAKIARQYGSRVSNAEIRNNPNTKAEVCRFMGFDTRVSHICQQYRDGSSRSR